MACSVDKLEKQFPWGYFVACLSPIVLIGMIFILPSVLGPQDSMGPAMLSRWRGELSLCEIISGGEFPLFRR